MEMNAAVTFILAIISGMLVDNVLLSRFYGCCSFIGVSKKVESAVGMGIAVVFVIIFASIICWPIYNFILVPLDIAFMDTITYILVIASLVQFIAIVIKKYMPKLYNSLGIYLPLITTNCAVLGVVQANTDMEYSFALSMASAIGTSLGFLLVIVVFACIRNRLDSCAVPKCLKGTPIALITASLMSIAFLGFLGMITL